MARVIDGPAGALRLRVLRSGEVRACYLHLHGGGWALGGADRQDPRCLVESAARLAVVSVDYRLAPSIRVPQRWRTASPRSAGLSQMDGVSWARRVRSTVEVIESNLAALELELDPELLERLNGFHMDPVAYGGRGPSFPGTDP